MVLARWGAPTLYYKYDHDNLMMWLVSLSLQQISWIHNKRSWADTTSWKIASTHHEFQILEWECWFYPYHVICGSTCSTHMRTLKWPSKDTPVAEKPATEPGTWACRRHNGERRFVRVMIPGPRLNFGSFVRHPNNCNSKNATLKRECRVHVSTV